MAIRSATFGVLLTAALITLPLCAMADPAYTSRAASTRATYEPRVQQKQKTKQKVKVLQKAALYAVSLPILNHSSTRAASEVTPASRFGSIQYRSARPQVEVDPEKQLQLLNEDQPFEISLQDNLKLEWQVKSYMTREDDFDVGMKVGLRYRF